MNKKFLRGYILIAFVFIIYGAATVPFPKTVVFWIAFVFSVISILAQAGTLQIMMKSKELIKDRVYDFPLIRISALYLIIQLLTSLLIMGFSDKIPVYAAVIMEMVILAVAVMGFYSVGVVRTEVVRQDKQLEKDLAKMKELQMQLGLLISQCEEGKIRELLRKLSEEIRYSNPVSREGSADIEEEIAALFTEMEKTALAEDIDNTAGLCDRMTGLLRERDRICKYGK